MLWTLTKCVASVVLLPLIGASLAELVIVFVATVNDWGDSPGGGFVMFIAGIWGAFTGFLVGCVLAMMVWEQRDWEANKSHSGTYFKAFLVLVSLSLLPDAFFSATTTAHDRLHVAIGCGFALLILGLAAFCMRFVVKSVTPTSPEL
jgi:hypothetical protein